AGRSGGQELMVAAGPPANGAEGGFLRRFFILRRPGIDACFFWPRRVRSHHWSRPLLFPQRRDLSGPMALLRSARPCALRTAAPADQLSLHSLRSSLLPLHSRGGRGLPALWIRKRATALLNHFLLA